jgi:hypothetical protein
MHSSKGLQGTNWKHAHTHCIQLLVEIKISAETQSFFSGFYFKINSTQGADSGVDTWSWILTPIKFACYQLLEPSGWSLLDSEHEGREQRWGHAHER